MRDKDPNVEKFLSISNITLSKTSPVISSLYFAMFLSIAERLGEKGI